jgi:hypothetical protein
VFFLLVFEMFASFVGCLPIPHFFPFEKFPLCLVCEYPLSLSLLYSPFFVLAFSRINVQV